MFTLREVVPWGRSFDEYCRMFALTQEDLARRIVGCGDGPASFNAEATRKGHCAVSCDPIYRFDKGQLEARIADAYDEIIEQSRRNMDDFVWTDHIRNVEELGAVRMAAMQTFLADYEDGQRARRYIDAKLPTLPFADDSFDLALCSHFLFLYSLQLGEPFHRNALREMGRIAREVRIFPRIELGGTRSPYVDSCLSVFSEAGWVVTVERVPYEFRRGGNEMMRMRRRL
jgi:hypothetical protein